MPQRYKLRLGDGTVLQVDRDGLQAWVEDDRRAMVQAAGTQQWRPLREFLAEEQSAARLRAALIPPEPRRATPSPPPEPEPPAPAFEPKAPSFEPGTPAFEPAAPSFEPGAPAFEPAAPSFEPGAPAFEPSAQVYEPPSPAYEPPAARFEAPAPAFEPPTPRLEPPTPRFEPPASAFEPAIGAPPVQALAEEPSVPTPPWQVPPEAPGGDAPAIRFKPMADEPYAPADDVEVVEDEPQDPYALARPRAYDARDDEGVGRQDRLEGPLLHVLTAFGTLLSQLVEPLTPLASRWPSTSSVAREPRAAARKAPRAAKETSRAPAPPRAPVPAYEPPPVVEPTPAPPPAQVSVLAEEPGASGEPVDVDSIPVVPLKPLDHDERPLARAWGGLSAKVAGSLAGVSAGLAAVSAWAAGLPGRLASLRQRDRRPESAVPSIEPVRRKEPSPPFPSAATLPRPPAPLRPPTPITELPSIRFKEGGDEPPDEGDVYDGEVGGEGWSILPVVWMWTKRIVLLGGLAAAAVLVALNWETWFPRAAQLGQQMFTEIDRQAHSSQRTRERDQAFTNAVERCPHLAPETIRLVLATNGDAVLEPPEVFGVATDAADRGLSTLPPAEAAELRALQRELASRLRPPQRARLAEYDRARATRVVFPFENPAALDLVARGARAMPAASRARLQELLGKAVAAGLAAASPAPAPADAGASR